jgi:hypothetical protein
MLCGQSASFDCPYLAAGTFRALGRIADEVGDSPDYKVLVTVLTPQQATRGLITNIDDLVARNMLNSGQGNALIAKLETASRQVDRGNVIPTINQLHVFINQVNALIGSDVLPPVEGRSLIDEANSIIAALMG